MLKVLLVASAATVACLATPAVAADKPNLAVYGALPNIETVEVSPDGSKLAFVRSDGNQRFLIIRKPDGAEIAGVALGAVKFRGLQWAGEEHVVYVTSDTTARTRYSGPPQEYFMAVDFNLTNKKQKSLLLGEKDAMNIVVGPPQTRIVDGDPIVYLEGMYFLRGQGANTLFRINLKTGATRRLDNLGARYGTDAWLVDAAGEPKAQSSYDGPSGRWTLLMRDGTFKVVDEAVAPGGSYGLSGFGRDGKSVLVWRTGEAGDNVLREYTTAGPTDITADPPFNGLVHDPATLNQIGGYRITGDDLGYTFFDPAAQNAWSVVSGSFKGERVALHSWSNDRKKVVVRVDSPTEGPAFAIVDLNTKRGGYLGPVRDGVNPKTISPVKSIKYKAADGLEISAYLTLPQGKEAKNLPLIVLPHGDPQSRDTPDFDWMSQALASRGYAVLRPNYRGSEGFGAAFTKAGFGEWGKKMQSDLSDWVRDLAGQGVVDAKRVCIMGSGYGGYAALAGATLAKGVYRCAVSVNGLSDLNATKQAILSPEPICGQASTFAAAGDRGVSGCSTAIAALPPPGRILAFNADKWGRQTSPRGWLRYMGVSGGANPDLSAISPAKLADRADIPVLLIHGKNDSVVPPEQSQAMADALKKAGKPVNLVLLDGEDHWLSNGPTRLKALTEAVAFIEKNNPAD